ncbi:MAG: hypothetical protein ACRC5M_07065, partial [Anaeroplasmataceae bacterium]
MLISRGMHDVVTLLASELWNKGNSLLVTKAIIDQLNLASAVSYSQMLPYIYTLYTELGTPNSNLNNSLSVIDNLLITMNNVQYISDEMRDAIDHVRTELHTGILNSPSIKNLASFAWHNKALLYLFFKPDDAFLVNYSDCQSLFDKFKDPSSASIYDMPSSSKMSKTNHWFSRNYYYFEDGMKMYNRNYNLAGLKFTDIKNQYKKYIFAMYLCMYYKLMSLEGLYSNFHSCNFLSELDKTIAEYSGVIFQMHFHIQTETIYVTDYNLDEVIANCIGKSIDFITTNIKLMRMYLGADYDLSTGYIYRMATNAFSSIISNNMQNAEQSNSISMPSIMYRAAQYM